MEGTKTLEQTVAAYFSDLVKKTSLEDIVKCMGPFITQCRMHDRFLAARDKRTEQPATHAIDKWNRLLAMQRERLTARSSPKTSRLQRWAEASRKAVKSALTVHHSHHPAAPTKVVTPATFWPGGLSPWLHQDVAHAFRLQVLLVRLGTETVPACVHTVFASTWAKRLGAKSAIKQVAADELPATQVAQLRISMLKWQFTDRLPA